MCCAVRGTVRKRNVSGTFPNVIPRGMKNICINSEQEPWSKSAEGRKLPKFIRRKMAERNMGYPYSRVLLGLKKD